MAAYLNKKQTQSSEKPAEEVIPVVKPTMNDEYINKIRRRLQEDGVARKEREKRRRKVLVDQLQAHEALEVCFLLNISLLKINPSGQTHHDEYVVKICRHLQEDVVAWKEEKTESGCGSKLMKF